VEKEYLARRMSETMRRPSTSTTLSWSLIVKNVGALPGQAIIDAHAAAVAMGTSTRPLPELLRGGDSKVLIMPGQTVTVTGTLFDENAWPDVVKHVRSGQAVLTDTIRMSYQGGGVIWKSSFDYTAVFRFNARNVRIFGRAGFVHAPEGGR
jgi:hypothetical protein